MTITGKEMNHGEKSPQVYVPVTILSKRGSASLILIMPQKEIKKSTLLDRKRVEYARQKDLQSSTPSYRS